MKTTNDYLDEVKQRLGLTSDYKLAKWLGSSPPVISNYRLKKRVFDNYAATRIADALGIDAMEVIAAAEAEREKDEERRDYWRKLFKKAATASTLLIFISFGISGLQSGELAGIEIMRDVRRRLARALRALWRAAPRSRQHEKEKQGQAFRLLEA